jgi:hypothetical protein
MNVAYDDFDHLPLFLPLKNVSRILEPRLMHPHQLVQELAVSKAGTFLYSEKQVSCDHLMKQKTFS